MAVVLKRGKFYRDGIEEAPKFGDPEQIKALKEARKPKKCDCIMGFLNGEEIKSSTVDAKVVELYNSIKDSINKELKPEHLTDGRKGYIRKFNYCPKCGDRINWKA